MVEEPTPAVTHSSTQNHNQPNPDSTHPMVTRLRLGIHQPNPKYNCHVSTIFPIPKSYNIAFTDHNWQNAMRDEYNALIKNKTWILVPRPRDTNIVRSMWLFKHKYFADGSLSRYKARLVANGSSQQIGVDCDETFSPVVKPATIRTVLSILTSRHWPVHQLDVKNAFLHGHLSETVYMHQPPGFQDPQRYATRVGFTHSRCDSSLYIYRQGSDIHYLLIYVDDIILTASSATLLQRIITSLHSKFSMTDLGPLHYFLGISISRDATVDTKSKLRADGPLVSDPTLYRSIAGALQYLTFTWPNLSCAVQQICLFMHDPREPHQTALKRILRYVRGTLDFDYGLQLFYGLPFSDCAEAEYRGVANVVVKTAWLHNLLRDLHSPLQHAALVYCDNVSAVYMSSNPVQQQRTKQIDIDIHFVRDQVAEGHVRVLHVPSRYQFAYIFTKGLPYALFDDFRSSLSVCPSPALTAGGC
ncbi:ribonuclease H-like domain-containing protein [Tanacetum coccineum]